MIQSNYERLAHAKRINPQRVQYLEDTVKQLRLYHTKLDKKLVKACIVWNMIVAYDDLLSSINSRMEQATT